nr:AAA family ATPase [Motilibacter aurantiacus]
MVALVPAEHGWQVPAVLGYLGGLSFGMEPFDHVVTLHDRHDRFGAQLVSLTNGQVLELLVERPPTDPAQALEVAREHYEYCIDAVDAEKNASRSSPSSRSARTPGTSGGTDLAAPGAAAGPRTGRAARVREVPVVAVVSLKGGVGKTSVTLGLGGAAAARGVRALVVDLDPQGNATTVLDPPAGGRTVADVLAAPRSGALAAAVAPSGWGDEVGVVASEPGLRGIENGPAPGPRGDLRLRTAMQGLDEWPLVLLDCPPTLGPLTSAGLAAATHALVVTEPTLFALHGAAQALAAVEDVRKSANLGLRAAGIVVNRVRPRSAEHAYRLRELAAAYPQLVLSPPVPDRTAVQQAAGAYVSVHALCTPGGRAVAQAFDSYLDHLLALPTGAGPLEQRAGHDVRAKPAKKGRR